MISSFEGLGKVKMEALLLEFNLKAGTSQGLNLSRSNIISYEDNRHACILDYVHNSVNLPLVVKSDAINLIHEENDPCLFLALFLVLVD